LTELAYSLIVFTSSYSTLTNLKRNLSRERYPIPIFPISDCHTIEKIPELSGLTHWDRDDTKRVFDRCRKQMQDLDTKELILVAECFDDLVQAKIGPLQTCFDARWEKAVNDKEKLMQLCIAFYKKTISRNKRHSDKDAEGFFEITRDHVNPGEVKKKKIVQLKEGKVACSGRTTRTIEKRIRTL
jgi:hypothetical protein